MREIEKILRNELLKEAENNNNYHNGIYFKTTHAVLKIVFLGNEFSSIFLEKSKIDFEKYIKAVKYENKIFKHGYSELYKDCKLTILERICLNYGGLR